MFRSYKVTPRFQNAHAQVNAAFLATVDSRYTYFFWEGEENSNPTKNILFFLSFNSLGTPSLVYGGLGPDAPPHAAATEAAMADGNFADSAFLQVRKKIKAYM